MRQEERWTAPDYDIFVTKLNINMDSVVPRLQVIRNTLTNPKEIILLDSLKNSIKNIHTYTKDNSFNIMNGAYRPYRESDLTGKVKNEYDALKKEIYDTMQEVINTLSNELQYMIYDAMNTEFDGDTLNVIKLDETKLTLEDEKFKKFNETTLASLRRSSSAHLLPEHNTLSLALDEDNFRQTVEMTVKPLIQDYKNLTGFNVEIEYSRHVYSSLENLVGIVVGEFTDESDFTVKMVQLSISYPTYIHLINSYGVDSANRALNNTLGNIERSFKEATFYFKTNKDQFSHSVDSNLQENQFITKLINNMDSIVVELHLIRNSLDNPRDSVLIDELKSAIKNIHTYVRLEKFTMIDGIYQSNHPNSRVRIERMYKYSIHKKAINSAIQEIENNLSIEIQHAVCDVLHK